MRILCWGTYDTGKPRTRILHQGLRALGHEVVECHTAVWRGIEDKSQVKGSLTRLGLLLRWLASYPGLVWRFLRSPRPDLVLIGFPGVLDAIVLAPFARLRKVPVAWDVFMSLFDTVAIDRRLVAHTSGIGRLLRAVEGFALRRCDLVFLDTGAHARRVESLFGLPEGRAGAVWVGAELEHFRAPSSRQESASSPAGAPLKILFYGQFIPLHGIRTIIEAAREMRDEPVEWTLIGRGQESEAIAQMLQAQPLSSVRCIEWVGYEELQDWIARADLCLGIFGTSEKAASVIPNKVFQIVAAGRPLVTRDSPAIRELLSNTPPCAYLVPPDDAAALADSVRAHLRVKGPGVCHASLRQRIGAEAIGEQFMRLIETRLPQVLKGNLPHVH